MATAAPTPSRAAALESWLRERTTTTPGRLVLVSLLTVAGAIFFGVIATTAEHSRSQAASAVRNRTEPLLVQAVTLYTKLSDANATATATFVTGGPEPPAARARYDADLRSASDAVAALTREVGQSARAGRAVRTIIEQLPAYAGLVETARANNRQGFPVGAAYLRSASSLLGTTILPAADHLYAAEAKRLSDDYGTGRSTLALVVLVAVILIALVVLLFTQRFLTGISQRILNVPMVLGTLVLLAVAVWAIVGLLSEQSALASARRQSDSVQVLSATSVLFSRAQSDQSLTLVGRGSNEVDAVDLPRVLSRLGSPGGLISEVVARARTAAGAQQLNALFGAYRAQATATAALQNRGLTRQAISSATTPGAVSTTNRLTASLGGQIGAAQRRFASAAADATSALAGLSVAIPLLTAVAAVLALLGLRQRLLEYR